MMLPPGSRIGIIGGGQLGRMLAMAAARLGFDVAIYSDAVDSPAGRVSADEIVAGFDDEDALRSFAASVDAITVEFENVPAAAAAVLLEAGPWVRPGPYALATAQDRVAEKRFFNELGVKTAAFEPIDFAAEVKPAAERIGGPLILKTRRMGYDGKGQVRLGENVDGAAVFDMLGSAPCVLERLLKFEREISVVAARGSDGAFAAYDPCENIHDDGILRKTLLPARIDAELGSAAIAATHLIAEKLDYVGVLCVEYFVMPDGQLLANEMAPRVHNSGHWTEAAARTCQFEQHIRAVAGWPLGSAERFADVEMTNLIGHEAALWRDLAADPAVKLHLYGKRSMREGRKMGHATKLTPLSRPPA